MLIMIIIATQQAPRRPEAHAGPGAAVRASRGLRDMVIISKTNNTNTNTNTDDTNNKRHSSNSY